MQRRPWFEIHDHRLFPQFLRDLVTEALESVWNESRIYAAIAPRLREALDRSGAACIVDLCSGGGGPWLGLYQDVAASSGVTLVLTDKYPNACAFAEAERFANKGIIGCRESVDATCLPPQLQGFRTLFSSFHHFSPEQARAMLEDAFFRREGIAVFEAAQNNARTLLATMGVPLLALRNSLRMRPFRWKRFFWTWLVPVIPAILLIDGMLSCLRSYSQEDLRELIGTLSAPDYAWQAGEERRGLIGIMYLTGVPVRASLSRSAADASARAAQDVAAQVAVKEEESYV